MGILDKFKNLFTDEIEDEVELPVEEEIKKVEMHVEIPAPAKPTKETRSDLLEELMETEEKKPTAIYFDDKDFDILDYQMEEKPVIKPQKNLESMYATRVTKEVPKEKTFKPSPIISPIYGVLDKNYKKEDITSKKSSVSNFSKDVSLDDVRDKAYGTLEDDLKSELVENQLESDILTSDVEPRRSIEEKEEYETETNDNDLFNMIDKMYESGVEENE